MDNPEEFRSIELCAGYNGIHLGLKRVIKNLRTVAYVEIESFADANLVAKMEAGHLDAAPIWTDLKTFNAKPFRDRIHLVTGGYPCQPFSAAGKRLGADDPRHLWPYIYKTVETIRPVFCFFENVEGHLSLGFKEVQQSLRDLGYAVEAGIFSAAECGAPQQRKRLFILAYSGGSRSGDKTGKVGCGSREQILRQRNRPECSIRTDSTGSDNELAYTSKPGPQGMRYPGEKWRGQFAAYDRNRRNVTFWPSRPGESQHEWEPSRVVANDKYRGLERIRISEDKECGKTNDVAPQSEKRGCKYGQTKSEMGRNSDGCEDRLDNAKLYESSDNRTDELRLLGNGVMPDVAEKAFITLLEKINENQEKETL